MTVGPRWAKMALNAALDGWGLGHITLVLLALGVRLLAACSLLEMDTATENRIAFIRYRNNDIRSYCMQYNRLLLWFCRPSVRPSVCDAVHCGARGRFKVLKVLRFYRCRTWPCCIGYSGRRNFGGSDFRCVLWMNDSSYRKTISRSE